MFFQLLPTAEALIGADPETYFKTATWNYEFDPVARKDYFTSFSSPEGIHGVGLKALEDIHSWLMP